MDEGNEFTQWGIEGEIFEKTDEVASGYRTLDNNVFKTFNSGVNESLQKDYGFGNVAFARNTEITQSKMNEAEIDFQQRMIDNREVVKLDPTYPMSQLNQEQVALISKPLQDTINQYPLRLITGQYPLDRWDEFMTDLENQNVEDYLDSVNNVYLIFHETLEDIE